MERKKTRVSCEECGGGEMVELSLLQHMERTHGIFLSQNRGVDIGVGGRRYTWCPFRGY